MVTRNPFATVAASPAAVGLRPQTPNVGGGLGRFFDFGGPVSPPGFQNPPTMPTRTGPGLSFPRDLPAGDPTFAAPMPEFSQVAPTASPALASAVGPAPAAAGAPPLDANLMRLLLLNRVFGQGGDTGGDGDISNFINAMMLGRTLMAL